MRNLVKVLIIFLLVFVVGCSSDDDNNGVSVADSVLTGKVFGTDFIAKGGKAFKSGESIAVNITNTSADCTSSVFDYEYKISTYIKEVGTFTNANVVFGKKGETSINQLGSTVIVESISDTSVVLRIKSNAKEDNLVEGKFTVPFCK